MPPLSIMVLGGGPPPSLTTPLPFVQPRYHASYQLYTSNPGSSIICLSAGTFHVPNLKDECGMPVTESYPCALYLNNLGVPPTSIHVDTMSLDTLGNAWWGIRTVEDMGLPKNVAVVTSDFHGDRSVFAFEWAGVGKGVEIIDRRVPDVGIQGEVLEGRRIREGETLSMYRNKREAYERLEDYMWAEHGLYSGEGVLGRLEGKVGEDGAEKVVKCGRDKVDGFTLRSYGGRGGGEEGQARMWREGAFAAIGFLIGFLINWWGRKDVNSNKFV